ncbi:cupin domain-containing protein [Caproiciproducens sp. R1]|uniref:cupin domain-containing protein n=1 Tax=Caproiciproducens sp. R1 TaxID=3435000 RepID=UPI00403329F4
MKYYERLKDIPAGKAEPYITHYMLKEENGCVAGCSAGISIHTKTEYPAPGNHADQEGFLVLEGTGWAKVGSQEFKIEPETSFIVPANMPHTIKKDIDSIPVKVFWFHAAI